MYIRKEFSAGSASVYGTNLVYSRQGDNNLIACTFIESSRTKAKGFVATLNEGYALRQGYRKFTTKGEKFRAIYKPVNMGRDRFTLCTVLNKEIGSRYLLTDVANLHGDVFNYLMINYKLPLLREWMPQLLERLCENRLVDRCTYNTWQLNGLDKEGIELLGINVHGRDVKVSEMITIDFAPLSEDNLQIAVSDLIKEGTLEVNKVKSKPLSFKDFDEYISVYGPSLANHLSDELDYLSDLNGELEGFAAKTKRLYPQQAACINGIIALRKAGSQYGLMIEGMGCGKTLQGAAVVDAYFNQRWLEAHPGKDLKDLYLSEEQPKYRNILMAPSHLVSKWKEEIMSEIPGAEVRIVKSLDDLVELRAQGKERRGREWYLFSKDFAKLGSQLSPIPTNVAKMVPKGAVCRDCLNDEESSEVVFKEPGAKTCKKCGGRHFIAREMPEFGKKKGLVCPRCGNLLLRPTPKYSEKAGTDAGEKLILTPADFAGHHTWNDTCTVCGEHLWGVDCKPIGTSQEEDAKRRRWYKISHFKNFQKKNRDTAFVLKGHESDYTFDKKNLDVKKSPVEYGPRRFAPSMFVKKYLKGYFDFCVLDEAHKYESGGSAQSIAAHAFMKASAFTLALTGTITNGRADSLFYLLYMLDPRRMNKRGYTYSDVMAFSKTYGCVETLYEVDGDGEYRSQSRGRQRQSPQVKPGISPLLFTDFLLDKSVFLDLADLSSYLPALKEQVVICENDEEVQESYSNVIETLKQTSREKGGRSVLSTMLQFGLAYPDKPYGFNPIMHPKFENTLITNVPSLDRFREGELLPKEEKLIEIVNKEIAQDRNCFIYGAFTGSEEMNITKRLKDLVESKCNLKGQVLVMEASKPQATEREQFIKEKAAAGIRVFICNMKLVETGLDFCFKYEGASYNYPTIIFYQLTYELAVMWQASRRHYRLNQKEECHTYYMATEGTLQQMAVQIMAEKQVAASAIQGKFSVDGLASMAKGVDPRIKLAQMLANEDDGMDRKSLENMFDVMNQNASTDDDRYATYIPPKTFYEVMDGETAVFDVPAPVTVTEVVSFFNTEESETKVEETKEIVETTAVEISDEETKTVKSSKTTTVKKKAKKAVETNTEQLSIFNLFGDFKPFCFGEENEELEQFLGSKKKKEKKAVTGQMSLFDLVA